ncbi:MAG: hypothetical protein LBL01_02635, partial [Bifidobacteriaceae bacterium]|nr:hypothetical protein [Bifidobacteriaceae bacterium]
MGRPRKGRRGATALAAVAALAALAATSAAGPARGADQTASDADPLAAFGRCLEAANGRGDLLILMDESASLRGYPGFEASDPDGNRVVAGDLMLDDLANAAQRNQEWDGLEVSIAGFSSDYETRLDWTALPGGLDQAKAAMDAQADRNAGQETDYWHALTAATAALTARQGQGEASGTCQAIVWFSDGAFSLEPNVSRAGGRTGFEWAPGVKDNTREAVQEAERAATGTDADFKSGALCKGGGVADAVRANGIYLFGVGLASKDAPEASFGLMKAMAEGPAAACGDQAPKGKFYPVASMSQLSVTFDEFGDPSQASTKTDPAEICQGGDAEECLEAGADYFHEFVLDDSITEVTGLGTAPAGDLDMYLVPPGGKAIELAAAGEATSPGGVALSWNHRATSPDTVTTVTLVQGDGTDWTGLWKVFFIDPAGASDEEKSTYSFRITADIKAIWTQVTPDADVQPGAAVEGKISWAHQDGQPIEQLKGNLSLKVALGQQEVTPQAGGGGDLMNPETVWTIQIPEGQEPGEASLALTPHYVTAGAGGSPGSDVTGATATYKLTVLPLPGYPAHVDNVVSLGELGDGALEGSGQLGFEGPGCLWLESAEVTAEPTDSEGLAWSSPANSEDNCVLAAEGEKGSLEVNLAMDRGGNGQATGALKIMAAPDGSGEPREYQA